MKRRVLRRLLAVNRARIAHSRARRPDEFRARERLYMRDHSLRSKLA